MILMNKGTSIRVKSHFSPNAVSITLNSSISTLASSLIQFWTKDIWSFNRVNLYLYTTRHCFPEPLPALVLEYLMKYHQLNLMEAGRILQSKWDATWPCDKFAYDLVTL
jgi:hypothetical protein